MKIISNSVTQTIDTGVKIAKRLKKGDVVALIGELGAGKTVLTKGIAKGLDVKDIRYVNSPTFVIIKEYKGRIPLYHFDLYRLEESKALDEISYSEYFYGDGVSVIEWADKIRSLLPSKRVEIRLSVKSKNEREIVIKKLK